MEPKHAFHLLKQLIIKHGQVRHNDALETLHRVVEKGYTVIGIYADNYQSWMAHVEKASSPKDAAEKGINITYNKGENGVELENIFVIEVVKGQINGVLGNDAVINLKDLKSK